MPDLTFAGNNLRQLATSRGRRWSVILSVVVATFLVPILSVSPVTIASLAHPTVSSPKATAATPLTWDGATPVPAIRASFAAAASANGKIYIVGGSDWNGETASLEEFDPITNSWTTRPNLPTPRDRPGAATLGSELFVVGGNSIQLQSLATAEEFDPATETWRELPPMPTARSGLGLAAGGDGRIYAIGGSTSITQGITTTAVEAFDPVARTWMARSPMPAALSYLNVAEGSDGQIYALGAISSAGGWVPQLEVYDPLTNQWTTIQNSQNAPSFAYWSSIVDGSDGRLYALGQTVAAYSPATNAWTTLRPSPSIPYEVFGAAALGIDGRIYLFPSGTNSNSDTQVAVYNPATNVWIPYPPMPTPRTELGGVATSDGSVYAIGGIAGVFGPVAAVEQYVPSSDNWITRASLPAPSGYLGVALASSNHILAIGGQGPSGTVSTVESYDPASNTWTGRAPLPAPLQGFGVAHAADGKIYVAGGISGSSPRVAVSTVEAYDPDTDSWIQRASMLTPRTEFSLAAAPDGKLYAIGGDTQSAYSGTVEAYDPATNQWTWRASLPPPARWVSAATGADGRIYAVGGSASGPCCATQVDVYDPSTDMWAETTPLLVSLSGAVAVADGNSLYLLGGWGFGGGLTGDLERAVVCPSTPSAIGPHRGRSVHSTSVSSFKVFLPLVLTTPATACS